MILCIDMYFCFEWAYLHEYKVWSIRQENSLTFDMYALWYSQKCNNKFKVSPLYN